MKQSLSAMLASVGASIYIGRKYYLILTRAVILEKGHSKRECEVEQAEDEFERVVLKCGNCSALDHRLRDCPEPRKPDYNPNACKNCKCVSVLILALDICSTY